MKRAPLGAMLALLAAVAATFVLAGCGGKSTSHTTTTTHKHKTTSAY
jgi:ABC-type uncharacterized transport system auxiliary subunit